MQEVPYPLTRDIVLIGGGHTHALVLRKWGMAPLAGARLTLINPGPTAPYSGMLPGHVAGHYPREALDIDLVRLARFAGSRLILGAAEHLDTGARLVHVPGRPPIAYDLCSVDIGITSEMPGLPGFAEHGVPAKPLGRFADAWQAYASGAGAARVAVIGAGVAGVELALAMAHRLQQRDRPAQIHLIDAGAGLRAVGATARARLRDALRRAGVTLIENRAIKAVRAGGVELEGGEVLAADFVTGAAGARAHPWLAASGLELQDGFIKVDPCLQSSDPAVFAVGDCAHLVADPRPKAGVYAVRQAPILLRNLCAAAGHGRKAPYRAQRDYLKLISLGGKAALGERFGLTFSGPWVWRLKDRIDRNFMNKFSVLPRIPQGPLPPRRTGDLAAALGDKPLCGGCGAKIGREALRLGLSGEGAAPFGEDAAILETGGVRQVISTDHLRALNADPVLMTEFAAEHALGDIWAMAAEPQAAVMSLVLPRQSDAMAARELAEIRAVARRVLGAAGAELVGGHTSLGGELTIGFTVTGICQGAPVTLAGARPGDALILTKPLGSGTVLAAEMAGAAPGAVVVATHAAMRRSQKDAAALLGRAHAMTDVTGFGLIGHLLDICEASGCGAVLDLSDIPFLPGALALARAGHRSSLYAANRALAPELPDSPECALLFDPQTCGGLLAAVPGAAAAEILGALRAAGYPAARIGQIAEGAGVTLNGAPG